MLFMFIKWDPFFCLGVQKMDVVFYKKKLKSDQLDFIIDRSDAVNALFDLKNARFSP